MCQPQVRAFFLAQGLCQLCAYVALVAVLGVWLGFGLLFLVCGWGVAVFGMWLGFFCWFWHWVGVGFVVTCW